MNKKQIIAALLALSVLFNLDAGVKEWFKAKTTGFKRGAQCFFAPSKYKCSPEERKKARKWGIGVSVGAATAAAAAIGIGITANEVRKRKAAAEAEEAQRTAEAARPTQPIIPDAPPAPAPATPVASGGPLVLPTGPSEQEIQQLTKEIKIGGIVPASTPFGNFFDRVIKVKERGQNIFQTSVKKVEDFLEDKQKKADAALKKVGEAKNKLLAEAKSAYQKAVDKAKEFASAVHQGGPDFYKQMLDSLFGIDYQKVKESMADIQLSLTGLTNNIKVLNNLNLWKKLNTVQAKWNTVQLIGYKLATNLSDTIKQLLGRKHADQGGWLGYVWSSSKQQPEDPEERRKIGRERIAKFPLAHHYDSLTEIYPEFIAAVRNLNMVSTGKAAQAIINKVAQIFDAIAETHKGAGVWGRLLLSNDMITPLKKASRLLTQTGENLNSFLESEPLQHLARALPATIEDAPIRSWFTALLWQPLNTVSGVKDIWNNQVPRILESNTQLMNALRQTTGLSDTLTKHSSNMWSFIKQTIQNSLKQKPFQNYVSLANEAVRAEAKISKELFNDTLLYTAGIVNYLEKMLTGITNVVETVNTLLNKKLVSSDNIAQLRRNSSNLQGITKELAELRNAAKRSLNI